MRSKRERRRQAGRQTDRDRERQTDGGRQIDTERANQPNPEVLSSQICKLKVS